MVVVGGACVLAFGGPMARAASEPGGPSGAVSPLVEAPSCAAPTGEVPVIDLREGQTLVSFDVPATTRLQVSTSTGAVSAVATNTGCAPRGDDLFVVVGSPGRAATGVERAVALSAGGAGDWREPGTWHAVDEAAPRRPVPPALIS